MPDRSDTWISPDGSRLGYKVWCPGEPPRATIVALHGLSCRESDFDPLGQAMSEKNIRVAACNLRGQGLDPVLKRHGAWLETEGMAADLEAFVEKIVPDNEPLFLCGDSMGALLSLQAAIQKPWRNRIAGLLLFSPVVALAQKTPALLKSLLTAVSRIAPRWRLKPSWFVHGKGVAPQLTRIAERQHAILTAPHRLGPTTIGFLVKMGDLIAASTPAALRLTVPVAVFSAGHDAFVSAGQTQEFFALIRSPDKTHFHYAESYHQLLFDLDAPRVLADAVTWVETRLPTNTSTQ